ncbi:hypothetical protein SAMN05421869_13095 [Nonomuraea jiangxiensis]|uniref:Uncharacterized protein n=1 Tax=Nonomuraea jiangxiensis TaxID=633440 RepID=A0A1G9MRX8_9ACTN|nr:hypothetical protein SAMN05421869_13095 [Nonomuraea jiangxiensis]
MAGHRGRCTSSPASCVVGRCVRVTAGWPRPDSRLSSTLIARSSASSRSAGRSRNSLKGISAPSRNWPPWSAVSCLFGCRRSPWWSVRLRTSRRIQVAAAARPWRARGLDRRNHPCLDRTDLARPLHPGRTPHGRSSDSRAVMTSRDDATTQRRHHRDQSLRISTVLAGVLHLVLAALLIGVPASSPTLDEVPVPEDDHAASPPAALSRDPVVTPVRSAAPVQGATPSRPSGASVTTPTRRPRPTPITRRTRATPPATARITPPRQQPTVAAAFDGLPRATTRAIRPTKTATRPPRPNPSREPTPRHTPPGQTREPPGQAAKSARGLRDEHPARRPDIPPGQLRKMDITAASPEMPAASHPASHGVGRGRAR